ncbi:unnamed protein product [Amoebophrya sp. A120]|nr:unnamed protein product [Amoebophrya sp. A120]|eukprot:GSA120T00005735001.1
MVLSVFFSVFVRCALVLQQATFSSETHCFVRAQRDWSPRERLERREKRLTDLFPTKDRVPRLLLLVPGHGEAERWPWISDTLNRIAAEWRSGFEAVFEAADVDQGDDASTATASRDALHAAPQRTTDGNQDQTDFFSDGTTRAVSTPRSNRDGTLHHKRDLYPHLGCVVYVYKTEEAYSLAEVTEKDRRLGNFTATHCEIRRRVRFNWTGFLQLSAMPDPAVRPGRLDTDIKSDNATVLVSAIGRGRENNHARAVDQRETTKYVQSGRQQISHDRAEQNALFPLIEQFDYILAILDDISVEAFSVREFLGVMRHNGLNVATPFVYLAPGSNFIKQSILDAVSEEDPRFGETARGYRAEGHMSVASKNALFGSLYQRGIAGTRLRAWEVQMTMFRKDAFYCWAHMVDPGTNPIGWGYDMLYYDLCEHTNAIGFVSGPKAEVFHLAERFLQGLSSNRYVMDDETFPLPTNVKPQFVKVGDLGRLNDHGTGGALDQDLKVKREEARKRALDRSRGKAVSGLPGEQSSTVVGEGEDQNSSAPAAIEAATAGEQDGTSPPGLDAGNDTDGSYHGIHGMPDFVSNAPKESYIEVIGQYQIAEAMMENWLQKKKITPYWELEKNEKAANASNETSTLAAHPPGEGTPVESEEAKQSHGSWQSSSKAGGNAPSTSSSSGHGALGFVVKACLVALEDDLMFMRGDAEDREDVTSVIH